MGKISPYSLGNISQELEQFRDETTNLINLGKVQYPTITSAPTWIASKGEGAYVMPASGGTTFWVYRNTAWVAAWSVAI